MRDEIRADVLQNGYDADTKSFVQYYGAKHPDAALLMLPLVGFLPADDPRMRATVDAIRAQLEVGGFVLRYPTSRDIDGLPPGEGVFLPCTFWLADNLALQGRREEARELFERLLAIRNDVGLLAEEYDPRTKQLPAGLHPRGAHQHRDESQPPGERAGPPQKPGVAPLSRLSALTPRQCPPFPARRRAGRCPARDGS